ncbi:MAG: magnesium transporter [Chitinophagia bacterium]|nr:magnesium transporter [Chitinophagia bacterium]
MLVQDLREKILEGDLSELLHHSTDEDYATEVAKLLESLPVEYAIHTYLALPENIQIKIFPHIDHVLQLGAMEELPKQQVSAILNGLASNDRVSFFDNLDGVEVTEYLNLLNDKNRLATYDLLGYPEKSVARLINTNFTTVKKEWTVGQATEHLRVFYASDTPAANVVFVVDNNGKLVDDIPIRRLVLNDSRKRIADIMDGFYVKLDIQDSIDSAIQKFKEYDRVALPVTNSNNVVMGVVTIDDVIDEAEEKDTKEIQQFGGLESLDLPYVKTPFFTLIRKRAVWLIILFLSEMLTATAMGHFQNELDAALVLSLFVPLIISSGGNSGSQAATLIIRALAINELTTRKWWYVMQREILSGLTLGLILGVIGFIRIAIWQQLGWSNYGMKGTGEYWYLTGLTVSFSLIGIVLWGTLSGSMIPLILKRLDIDPATSSAPFVATLVDVTGLIIYFSIAAVILSGSLLKNVDKSPLTLSKMGESTVITLAMPPATSATDGPFALDDSTIRVPLPPGILAGWHLPQSGCVYSGDDYKLTLVKGWAYYDVVVRHSRQNCMVVYPVKDGYRSFDWALQAQLKAKH